jgi:hypothetical protein
MIQAGRDDFNKESWPWGGMIGRTNARASSDRGRGKLWATTREQGEANLAEHHASAASWRGRAPVVANWPCYREIRGNQAQEPVPHLEKFGRGSWRLGRPAVRVRISGGLWRWRQSVREVGVGEMRHGRESGCGRCSKGSWGAWASDVVGVLSVRACWSTAVCEEGKADRGPTA